MDPDELDYGEGKTQMQESHDSIMMLGIVLLSMIIGFIFIATIVVLFW